MVDEQDQRISEAIAQEQARLRNFIRRRVPDRSDAEDILQDVFYELVEAYRLMKPIEQVGAWMFRVARNRITDLFRKKRPESLQDQPVSLMDSEMFTFEELLPSPDGGPAAAYTRSVLFEELDNALDELPAEQREVFIAHEIEGRSFKEQAVHYLWNRLMPILFHLPAITFWQAVGLLALSWLLFGGWRGFGGRGWGSRGPWRRRMQERWEQMTPEEREKMRAGMRGRCGPISADAGAKL